MQSSADKSQTARRQPDCVDIRQWSKGDGAIAWEFHVWASDSDSDPMVVGTRETLVEAVEATLQFVMAL